MNRYKGIESRQMIDFIHRFNERFFLDGGVERASERQNPFLRDDTVYSSPIALWAASEWPDDWYGAPARQKEAPAPVSAAPLAGCGNAAGIRPPCARPPSCCSCGCARPCDWDAPPCGGCGCPEPCGETGYALYLGTPQSVMSQQYLGFGEACNDFAQSAVTVRQDARIVGLEFSVRADMCDGSESISAEIVCSRGHGGSPEDTQIVATVLGPSAVLEGYRRAFVTADLPVEQCDLLSIRVTRTGNACTPMEGADAAILFENV